MDDDKQGDAPSDDDELVGDTAASEPLSRKDGVQPGDAASRKESGAVQTPPRKPATDRSGN